MQYWILKTEPDTWSWQNQLQKNIEPWNGVKNYQARNNIKNMNIGDIAFFYHTGKERKIVGIVEIYSHAYPDEDPNFLVVDVKTVKSMENHVTLQNIKNNLMLQNIQLVKQGRLSVVPLEKKDFYTILSMGNTKLN